MNHTVFTAATSPLDAFSVWLEDARADARIAEPTAMSLATATRDGEPSVRIVLLKAHGADGFVFYTNLESEKSAALHENPCAALCFYWMPLERQVRIRGAVERVADEQADAYFASRERLKQIGAWASQQSRPLPSREELDARITAYAQQFEGGEVPRPPHWSGWRVVPEAYEFWQQLPHRLHERHTYMVDGQGGWRYGMLYP